MRRSLAAVLVIVALVALTGCKNKPPRIPAKPIGPVLVQVDDSATYKSVTTDPNKDDILYVFDWKDGSFDTSDLIKSGDTISKTHAWTEAGYYAIRVKAKDAKGNWSADWSDPCTVRVVGDTTPGVNEPPNRPAKPALSGKFWIDSLVYARTSATDPDLDSVRIKFYWGDGMVTTTRPVGSGAEARDSIRYSLRGSKKVYAMAIDPDGDTSAWSEPESIYIDAVNTAPWNLGFVRTANPRRGIAGGPTYRFYAQATDLQGDSIRYTFYFPTGDSFVSPFVASGAYAVAQWLPTGAPGAYEYRVRAVDQLGAAVPTPAVDTLVIVDEGQIIWAWDDAFFASPALCTLNSYGGTWPGIVCGSDEGKMYFIDAYQSEVLNEWVTADPDAFSSSPAVGAGGRRFYAGCGDGALYAFGPAGDTAWHWPATALTGDDVATSPLVDGNAVYFGGEDKKLHKVVDNGATWTEPWSKTLRSELVSSPVMDPSGNIVVCDDSGYVYSFTANGDENWTVWTGDSAGVVSSPAVWTDGTIYVGTEAGRLHAIKDNAVLWTFEIPWNPPSPRTPISSSPIFGTDGHVYFTADDGKLYRIDPATHDTVPGWPVTISSWSISSTPCLCLAGVFYVADDADTLRAINPNGTQRWALDLVVPTAMRRGGKMPTPRRLGFDGQPSAMVDQYGIIYISTSSGIFAVAGQLNQGLATTPWPMFRRDVRHTGKHGGR